MTRAEVELGPRIHEFEERLANCLAERRALTKTVKRERRDEFNEWETVEFRDLSAEIETLKESLDELKERRGRRAIWRTPRPDSERRVSTAAPTRRP